MSQPPLNILVPTTGTPVHVASSYAADFQVANNSLNPVYLGGDSSVSITSGLLLNPGGSTTWAGGQDLWAVAVKGSGGMVTCLFNASGSYTPGPSVVNANITGGTVNIGSVGTPVDVIPQNQATLLVGGSVTFADPGYTRTFTNLAGYQTILINCNGSSGANPNSQIFLCTLTWYDSTGVNILGTDEFVFDGAGQAIVQAPVKGPILTFFLHTNVIVVPSFFVMTQLSIEGLTAALPYSYRHYYNQSPPFISGGTVSSSGGGVDRGASLTEAHATSSTASLYLDSAAGPAFVSVEVVTPEPGALFTLAARPPVSSNSESTQFLIYQSLVGAGFFTFDTILPAAPLRVQISGSTTGADVSTILQFQKQ